MTAFARSAHDRLPYQSFCWNTLQTFPSQPPSFHISLPFFVKYIRIWITYQNQIYTDVQWLSGTTVIQDEILTFLGQESKREILDSRPHPPSENHIWRQTVECFVYLPWGTSLCKLRYQMTYCPKHANVFWKQRKTFSIFYLEKRHVAVMNIFLKTRKSSCVTQEAHHPRRTSVLVACDGGGGGYLAGGNLGTP